MHMTYKRRSNCELIYILVTCITKLLLACKIDSDTFMIQTQCISIQMHCTCSLKYEIELQEKREVCQLWMNLIAMHDATRTSWTCCLIESYCASIRSAFSFWAVWKLSIKARIVIWLSNSQQLTLMMFKLLFDSSVIWAKTQRAVQQLIQLEFASAHCTLVQRWFWLSLVALTEANSWLRLFAEENQLDLQTRNSKV